MRNGSSPQKEAGRGLRGNLQCGPGEVTECQLKVDCSREVAFIRRGHREEVSEG